MTRRAGAGRLGRRSFALALLAFLAAPALADSEAAWEAFRAEVGAACLALVADRGGEAAIEVNPFGSEHYGAAIVTLTAEGEVDRMVCVFDKATRAAEITAPWTGPTDGG